MRRTHGFARVGHSGVFPGVNAHFEFLPELGYTIVVLANADAPAASWVAERAAHLVTRARTRM